MSEQPEPGKIVLEITPLDQLKIRRLVAIEAVKVLRLSDDPRAKEAEAHYQAQLNSIEAKILAITGKPPDINVQLKTAVIGAKSGLIK